jgi:hypothetical protein
MSDETCCGACGYPIHATKESACDWCRQSADLIEALEREVKKLHGNLQSYQCFTLNPYTDEEIITWLRDFRTRWVTETIRFAAVDIIERRTFLAKAAEAKLAKAVEGLREIAGECGCSTARALLAEIEGKEP